jgi:hypothetical protein
MIIRLPPSQPPQQRMSREELRAILFRPELFVWNGPGREPTWHRFPRLAAEAYLDGNTALTAKYLQLAQEAERKRLRGERERGRPPGARSRKPYKYQAVVYWCLAESAKSGCRDPYRLVRRAHRAGFIPGIESSEQLKRAQDAIGRRVKAALAQEFPK